MNSDILWSIETALFSWLDGVVVAQSAHDKPPIKARKTQKLLNFLARREGHDLTFSVLEGSVVIP